MAPPVDRYSSFSRPKPLSQRERGYTSLRREGVLRVTTMGLPRDVPGFAVYNPDMSMFTPGGSGVHCLSQALRRDAA